jgi:ketosteroid isomerase-like protein
MGNTSAERAEWLDRVAIQDLIYRYSDAVTRADWTQCEAVYSPDLIWECPQLNMRFDSRAAFLEMLRGTTGDDLLIQTASSPVVTLTGPDRATATTTIHEIVRGPDNNVDQYGVYFDDVARIDGEWRFTHRLFVLHYVAVGGVRGDVSAPRSTLHRRVD